MSLPNCWEFHACGREPGGINAEKDGVCEVAICTGADRIHYGVNGGRACWGIDSDKQHCPGRLKQQNHRQPASCTACEFYDLVHEQEGDCILAFNEIRQLVGLPPLANGIYR
jgi:hypothetical protein